MGRPTNKEDLIKEANKSYDTLVKYYNSMSEKELNTFFDFSSLNKSEKHWTRDKNLRDILIHLYEWQCLMIKWLDNNSKGVNSPFLPEEYNWSNYADMNNMFYQKHQATSLDDAKKMLEQTHIEVVRLISNYSNEELFNKNVFSFVGTSTLGRYFISVTIAHYEWALNKLKQHSKICNK